MAPMCRRSATPSPGRAFGRDRLGLASIYPLEAVRSRSEAAALGVVGNESARVIVSALAGF